jgi:hypothetical protein
MEPQALGRLLRQSREAKELTLDEVERALRIRRRILESFELGEFILPEFAPIQLRGFIRNYARYLGLEEDRILTFYEEALEELTYGGSSLGGRRRRRARGREKPARGRDKARVGRAQTNGGMGNGYPGGMGNGGTSSSIPDDRPRGGFGRAVLRLVLALAAIALIVVGAAEALRSVDGDFVFPWDQPPPDDMLVVGVPTSVPTFTPLPMQPSPTATIGLPLQPAFTGQGVLVSIEIAQRGYMRIAADGVQQYAGLARPGDAFEVSANNEVTITAGNAEGLRVVYNGQPQPIFGDRGQAVDLTFTTTRVNIVTGPGFDPTPIASATPIPSPTPNDGALIALLTPTSDFTPVAALPTALPLVSPFIPTSTLPVEGGAAVVDAPRLDGGGSGAQITQDTPTPLPGVMPLIPPTDAPLVGSPTPLPLPSQTVMPSFTPSPLPSLTVTPSNTPVPTDTPIPSPTAILPLRQVIPGATPTKVR